MEERYLPEIFGVSWFFLFYLVLFIVCTEPIQVSGYDDRTSSDGDQMNPASTDVVRLEAKTDAPGLIRAPVGFYVKLVGLQDNSSIYEYIFEAYELFDQYVYMYSLKQSGELLKNRWVFRNESLECNPLFEFYEPGDYNMRITVMTNGDLKPIAKTSVKFSISSNILGSIRVHQIGVNPPHPEFVSTNTEALITFEMHDPHDFLNGSLQLFGWSLNGRPPEVSGSSIRYNFTKPVTYTVMLMVTVINNTNPRISYFGAYSLVLKAREPVDNFNVSGSTSLKHGDLLDLKLTCEGSPPFSYCWRFTHEMVNASNQSCADPLFTTQCYIPIIRYFRKSGNYKLVVVLENEIEHTVEIININVFDSAPEPQLLPIIVPLVCCCLALVIIVVALMYYIQTRRQHSIEVADFDFQQSDSYEFRTFFQRVQDSMNGFCRRPQKERRYSYTLINAQVT